MEELNIQEKQQHEIAAALMQKYGEVYFIKAEEFNEIVEKINEIVSDKAGNEAIEEINEILDEKANASDLVNYLVKPEIATGKQYALIKSGSSWSWAEVDTLATGDISLSVPRKIDTNGNPFSIEELPDKRLDASFNRFLGMNSAGQFGHVGFEAFRAEAESWNDEQRKEFAQKLNGNFSNVGVSVNLISPPVFELEDNDVYVILRGANLNLHPTNRKIEILDASDETVLAEVPNGQVQTYSDGLQLVFYYNFNSLGTGMFKLKITNGAATYITTHNFQIVAEVTNIDLNAITWDIIYDSAVVAPATDYALGGMANMQSITSEGNTTNVLGSFKSSELFEQSDDFYIEINVNVSQVYPNNPGIDSRAINIGIGYEDVTHALLVQSLINYSFSGVGSNVNRRRINNSLLGDLLSPYSETVAIIKSGNLFSVLVGNSSVFNYNLSNNSGYSLLIQGKGMSKGLTAAVQIIKAYKFN